MMGLFGEIIKAVIMGLMIMICLPLIFIFGGLLTMFVPQIVIGTLFVSCILYIFRGDNKR